MSKTLEIECTGYSIKADWYEGESVDHVLLILQGYTSSRHRQKVFADYMVESLGVSALVIDYTGHGDSPFELKDTRPAQHVLEVISAFEWIRSNYPNALVSVIGNSYGSFLATHLARYRSFEKLVLRAPAIYQPQALYDLWSIRLDDEDAYRKSIAEYRHNEELLNNSPLLAKKDMQFNGPVLVVIHELDEIIPRQTSDAFISAFKADSFTAEGFSHAVSQSDVTDEQIVSYHKHIADWLK